MWIQGKDKGFFEGPGAEMFLVFSFAFRAGF